MTGIFVNFPNLGEQSKQAVLASLINPVAGAEMVKRPVLEEPTYYFVLDKSRRSSKQVLAFRYNQKGIEALSTELSNSH